ncbi:hypothetical protein AMD27_16815 (plasmid) [Acinetobacter sp. TGL-Y2]|uniref:hypothetical protein n=1 Tax=Acinetobacter sp. TGL-Y2 TaxID=1407071 RepID=UPI0007A669F5|nr:hypothetical protein [Acinetobacter sp. TGL-Y2]AMW80578.1 hypothetical protein AMD27_16815 [Acinetobacter sp. TGL-Y2]
MKFKIMMIFLCFAAVLNDIELIEQINQMFDLKIKVNESRTQIEKLIDIATGYSGFNFSEKEWKALIFFVYYAVYQPLEIQLST